MKPDLEEGFGVLQVGFLDSYAQQMNPKTHAATMLPREATAYERFTLLPSMVRKRDGEVACRGRVLEVSTAGEEAHSHCVPSTLGNTPSPLLLVLWGFGVRPPYMPGKGGGSQWRSRFPAQMGFCCKFGMRAARN